MNQFPIANPNNKSKQKMLMFWAIPSFIAAVVVLCWVVFRDAPEKVAKPVTTPAQSAAPDAGPMNAAALTPEAYGAKAFDLLLNKHDYAGAKALFEACLREYPDYADAYHGLAIAQRDTGDSGTAITNHNRAIELTPERADYYWWHGVTYQRLNDHDAAIKIFERGLEAQNKKLLRPGLLHVSLAQEYRARGDFQKALAYNEEAIALSPQNNWYYQERGLTYQALGDRERAAADFARGSASRSSSPRKPR